MFLFIFILFNVLCLGGLLSAGCRVIVPLIHMSTSHGWGWTISLWKFPGWCMELDLVFLKGSAMSSSVLRVSMGLVWFWAAYLLMGRVVFLILPGWGTDGGNVTSTRGREGGSPGPSLWFWRCSPLSAPAAQCSPARLWSPQVPCSDRSPLIYHFATSWIPIALRHKRLCYQSSSESWKWHLMVSYSMNNISTIWELGPLLKCLHLDKCLLDQQNTEKLQAKNNCMHTLLGKWWIIKYKNTKHQCHLWELEAEEHWEQPLS